MRKEQDLQPYVKLELPAFLRLEWASYVGCAMQLVGNHMHFCAIQY